MTMKYKSTLTALIVPFASIGSLAQNPFHLKNDSTLQTTQLQDVVVSSNRIAEKRRMASTLVAVVDARTFERTQSNTLAQGLKFQPGIRVETNCQNCGFSQVRINGLEGPYSQILIDSRPVFSALAGVYGLEQLPTNMIERVEVIRGGGSALFGSSAIAGTINIITKEPDGNSATLSHEMRGLGGLHRFENTTNFNASLVAPDRHFGLALFGQTRHRSAYDHDGDGFSEMPLLDGHTLGFRTYFKPTSQLRLTAEYHNMHEFRRGGDRVHVQPHMAFVAEQLEHTNHNASIAASYFSLDARHLIDVYASLMKVDRKSYYGGGDTTMTDLPKRLASYGTTKGLTYLAGAQYAYAFPHLFFMPARLTAGFEYKHDDLDDISGYRTAPIKQAVHTEGIFIQNEWKDERFSLLLGARFDKHSLLRHAIFSPRVNVRYVPTKSLTLRATYSRGFRAPQIFDEDLHVDNAGGELIISANSPHLKEETSHSFSLSADWTQRFGNWQVNLLGEAFYTSLVDAFSFLQKEVTENGKTYTQKLRTNSDGAKVFGTNLEARLSYTSLFNIQAGLTLQSSRWNTAKQWHEDDTYTTRRLYRTPNAYAYFVASFHPTKDFTFSLSGNYTGTMLTGHEIPTEEDGTLTLFNGKPSATIHPERLQHGEGQTVTTYGARTLSTPSFFELGLKASYDLTLFARTTATLYAGVQNIFNAYQSDFDRGPARDSAYTYGPTAPRCFYTGIKLAF